MDPAYGDDKAIVKHVEEIEDLEAGIDPVKEKRLTRKMDIYLMPLLTLLFLLNFIDRSAVGNANAAGLSADLKLSAAKYEFNIALMIFYIFYIVVEPFSNLLLKRYGAVVLSILVVGFGVVTIGSAFVTNYHQFIAVRVLLGIFEGGVIPGIALILTRFYRRHELVQRVGMFLALGPGLSGAFGGLLAGALVSGGPIGSVVGWRKIFLVEGIITTGVGFLSFWGVASSPETAWFLNEEEKALAVRRIASETLGETKNQKSSPRALKQAFGNLFTWLCCLGYGFINIPVQGTSIFLPTIIKGLGQYTTVEVQLRSVPPYVVACAYTLMITWICTKKRRHGYVIAGSLIMTAVGYSIFVGSRNSKVLYFATFLTFSGALPCGPIFLSWATANSSPETSRAISAALVPGIGSWGSIVATWSYLPKYAPYNVPGNSLNIGGSITAITLALLLVLYCKRENRLREEGKRDHRLDGLNEEQIADLGSRHPEFRYLI